MSSARSGRSRIGRGSGNRRGGRRGGRGYGRGGGEHRSEPVNEHISRNVREFCEVPEIDENFMAKLEENHRHGSEGENIKLMANYFALRVSEKVVYHYDVEIKIVRKRGDNSDGHSKKPQLTRMRAPNVVKRMRRLALKENMEIIRKLSNEWDLFRGVSYVYDGLKNMYTTEKFEFPNHSNKSSHEISIIFDGYQDQNYEVIIQYCNEQIDLSTINRFYRCLHNDIPEQAFQVLEIILKYMPIQVMVPIGRSLFSPLSQQQIDDNYVGENAVMAYGHYQSVRPTEVGVAVVIDRKATVLRFSGTLIEFIMNLIDNVRSEEDFKRLPFTNDAALIGRLNKHLSGLKIFTTHIRGEKRKYTIDRLTASRPDRTQFQWIEMDNVGNVVQNIQSTVAHYFSEKYKIRLQFNNIPCILLKGGQSARHLPAEICHVYPDQPLPRNLISKDITAKMVYISGQQPPLNRFSKILESADMIDETGQQIMENFGVHMSTKAMEINGRILSMPVCDGNDKCVKEGKKLNDWVFVNISPEVKKRMLVAKQFFETLTDTARDMGITIAPFKNELILNGDYTGEQDIPKIFRIAKTRCPNVQMIFFCIPSFPAEIYQFIKRYGDMVYGVITQCVKDDYVLDTPGGYFTNLLLKINSKLDGYNSVIPEKPTIIEKDAMIIGVDVSHSSPADRILSSIAACVGSYDQHYSKYSASITVQARSRDEIINEFGRMIKELLEQFKMKNKNSLPSTIILFRDGVSESQFDNVLNHEYKQLVDVCSEMGIPDTKITFVIVQKRHHTRFLPKEVNDSYGEMCNVPPGTVVDSIITNPVLILKPNLQYEYYLCSHFGQKGKSRPTKYVVLRDENNLSADEMQKLSYNLCFTYARTNNSISIPIPVMYAHLAAYRSKLNIAAQNIRTEGRERRKTQDNRRERELRNAAILNSNVKVNELLKNRLYFC